MRHESEKALHEALMMQSELEQRANALEAWQQNAEVQERKLAEVSMLISVLNNCLCCKYNCIINVRIFDFIT